MRFGQARRPMLMGSKSVGMGVVEKCG